MNLIDAVNQVLSSQDVGPVEDDIQLLGLPGRLIGADIAALQTDLTTHAAALSDKIGRGVHPAVAFLDLMGLTESSDEGGIDEFCILKKTPFRDLLQAAVHDRLTGLFSRNILESRLHQEFQRAKRYKLPLSLLFVDIDDFKSINDTYGHSEGDRVLSFIGSFILEHLREVDFPVRYGGEEFVITLPHTDGETALTLANRLHDSLGEAEKKAQMLSPITISIGVGTVVDGMDSEVKLLDAADRAVYLAKQKKDTVWPHLNAEDPPKK